MEEQQGARLSRPGASGDNLPAFERLLLQACARTAAKLPKSLVLYCGRHDYGTRVLKSTGNLAAVMKTMGHKDVKTAMQYQHPELEIVRAALNQTATGA